MDIDLGDNVLLKTTHETMKTTKKYVIDSEITLGFMGKIQQNDQIIGEIRVWEKLTRINLIFYSSKISRFNTITEKAMKHLLNHAFNEVKLTKISNTHRMLNKNETEEMFIKFYEGCGFKIDKDSKEFKMICEKENFDTKFPEFNAQNKQTNIEKHVQTNQPHLKNNSSNALDSQTSTDSNSSQKYSPLELEVAQTLVECLANSNLSKS